jgi:hypothetical protein
MNRTVMSAAALALAGAGALAFGQTQSPPVEEPAAPAAVGSVAMAGMRASAEDRAVLLDARLGAIRAALKLTPDQEKLWQPVEACIRKSAALQDQRIQEMRGRMAQPRDGTQGFDPIAKLRKHADRLTAAAERMREFADSMAPLYASLSEDQKRRAFLLLDRARGDVLGLGDGSQRGDLGGLGLMGRPRSRPYDTLDWHG